MIYGFCVEFGILLHSLFNKNKLIKVCNQAGNKQTQRVRSLEQSHTQNVSAHNLLFVYVLPAMSVKTVLNVPAVLS